MPFVKQILALLLAFAFMPAKAAICANTYLDMSLEELMDLTVTSMSKRAQNLQETAAAVSVITNEDIRRSGATSIPEALRLVPGLMVGQNNAGIWSVSSRGRGFNPIFENKLLVLIDGHSVYSPVYSGVFWETIDVIMEDIDRIEVIRGPGTSAWGANAVNGIVNIITKSAAKTQGFMASALYGSRELGTAALRHGGAFGENNTYRIFGKYRHLDEVVNLDGEEIPGALESATTGFRADLVPDKDSTLTIQGDLTQGVNRGELSYPDLTPPAEVVTKSNIRDILLATVLGRYERDLGGESSIGLQAYYTRDEHDSPHYEVGIDTLDLDFQHQFKPLKNHFTQWGIGYRSIAVNTSSDENAVYFATSDRSDNLFSAFVQDEISFADGRWILTLGSKFERNDQTGVEILPSARLLWHVTETHALWGAVSRSVRTPSVAEQDVTYHVDVRNIEMPPNSGNILPLRSSVTGDGDLDAENIIVWELGHRFSPSSTLFFDTSVYCAKAENLMTTTYSPQNIYPETTPTYHLQLDSRTENDESATMHGLELSATWVPLDWWKLRAWYRAITKTTMRTKARLWTPLKACTATSARDTSSFCIHPWICPMARSWISWGVTSARCPA